MNAWRRKPNVTRLSLVTALIFVAALVRAEEEIATLTLDGESFVSHQNEGGHGLPRGSVIRFRLRAPADNGAMSFEILPSDVQVPVFPIGKGSRGTYELARATSGVIQRTSNGLAIQFSARLRAITIAEDGSRKSIEHDLFFTTGQASAKNAAGTRTVAPRGREVSLDDGTVELVVATTTGMDQWPVSGAATFAYLVGKFDVVPGESTPVKRVP